MKLKVIHYIIFNLSISSTYITSFTNVHKLPKYVRLRYTTDFVTLLSSRSSETSERENEHYLTTSQCEVSRYVTDKRQAEFTEEKEVVIQRQR